MGIFKFIQTSFENWPYTINTNDINIQYYMNIADTIALKGNNSTYYIYL